MTLKAGTVCYSVGHTGIDAVLNGYVVTLTGARGWSHWYPGERTWRITPHLPTPEGKLLIGLSSRHLLPISDPDQPVDVTSDTDERVTA